MRKILVMSNKTRIFAHEYKYDPQGFYILKVRRLSSSNSLPIIII